MALERAAEIMGAPPKNNSEIGVRPTPENELTYLYNQMYVDPRLTAAIHDIRHMDAADGRVKKIHGRMARTATKGGLKIKIIDGNKRINSLWMDFARRTQLNESSKLQSDAKAIAMEGNLPLQVVLDGTKQIARLIRMPTETIRAVVDGSGTFKDLTRAYEQIENYSGKIRARFALWQLIVARLDPLNYDDMGCFGRPYLDSSREVWKKLCMTETDLVIRRRHRAPLRTSHILEGVSEPELALYKQKIEGDQNHISTNYYSNKKGGVTAIQGDANLDQIADVSHLLDTFFSGGPAPKGLFGYPGDLNRDILEDLKKDYFEEIDALQDIQSNAYEQAFRLDLLFKGINPNSVDFVIEFAERKTETPNQATDRALKQQSLNASGRTVWETAGLNPEVELARRKEEQKSKEAYPDDEEGDDLNRSRQRVSVTPGNAPKGESATSIKNK